MRFKIWSEVFLQDLPMSSIDFLDFLVEMVVEIDVVFRLPEVLPHFWRFEHNKNTEVGHQKSFELPSLDFIGGWDAAYARSNNQRLGCFLGVGVKVARLASYLNK